MSDAKRDALSTLAPTWSVTTPLRAPALDAAFARAAPRLLDVGVGTGEATLHWAASHPDHDVIAVELHRPGLARLLQRLAADGPTNVRVLEADVTTVIADLADLAELASSAALGTGARPADPVVHAVRVLFPDPWPKRRHRHRRLVDRSFVSAVADLLPPGGWLHLATDWDDYALQMRGVLRHEPRLVVDLDGGRPERPVTTYEGRGLAAGRHITDLVAHRRA